MSPGERARGLLAGLVAGLAGGLFGVGGGVLLVPLLTGWFRATQHQAHGTSLAVIGATAVAGIAVYGTHGNVAWLTAALVGAASALAARFGARLAARVSSRRLARAFAVFLVLVAARMLWRAPAASAAVVARGVGEVALDLLLGAAVGVLAGFMGVGGGILAVPAFTLLLGMPQQLAQGTSLGVILFAAPAGAFEHARLGNVLGRLVLWLGLGAALGGAGASWAVQHVPREALARAFAVFLLANAAHTWWRAARGPKS
uniref:Probable membrane transporter protein n=1 Tax=Eiseniibacteriota bacterium TaxID=2212470 RepID=A0A832I385_UNCEI